MEALVNTTTRNKLLLCISIQFTINGYSEKHCIEGKKVYLAADLNQNHYFEKISVISQISDGPSED